MNLTSYYKAHKYAVSCMYYIFYTYDQTSNLIRVRSEKKVMHKLSFYNTLKGSMDNQASEKKIFIYKKVIQL